MKNTKIIFPVFLMALCCIVSGCHKKTDSPPRVLSDLAYDYQTSESDYTVYLQEGGKLVPFLVLSGNYEGTGGCLLVRRDLHPHTSIYDSKVHYPAFYEESVIDRYLNEEYFPTLSEELQNLVLSADITITAKESLGSPSSNRKTKTIKRNVFLLSAVEIGHPVSRTTLAEGRALSYFCNADRRIAKEEDGTPEPWWLRTAFCSDDNIVHSVSPDGIIGIGCVMGLGAPNEICVRPAFCLPCDTPVTKTDPGFVLNIVYEI